MANNLNLYASCIPIKGYARSVISDLERNRSFFIPNSLFDLIVKHKGESIDKIKAHYDHKYDDIISQYYDFLMIQDVLNPSPDQALFPDIDLIWDTPSLITNAIICYNKDSFNFAEVIRQLESLGCKSIQVRFFQKLSLEELNIITRKLNTSSLNEIELILPYMEIYHNDVQLKRYFEENIRVARMLIYNSPFNKENLVHKGVGNIVRYITEAFSDNSFCGVIHPNNFTVNMKFFSEAVNHNSCLNRKISVDEEGLIKNCPSMTKSFGHADQVKLAEVLKNSEFTSAWHIIKDDVAVCRDCENRYSCLDCRAYHKNERSSNHPSKCNYNPYIAKWKGEEGYRTLAECGVESDASGFSIDHERIAEINEELWGED